MKSEIDSEQENRYRYFMGTSTFHTTIESSLERFVQKIDKSPSTIRTYRTDIQQFLIWLHANDITAICAKHVTSGHIYDCLRYLSDQGLTGTTCSRKLVSMHLFFTYLMHEGVILSPQLQR
jgi:site-specific recombinase XerD